VCKFSKNEMVSPGVFMDLSRGRGRGRGMMKVEAGDERNGMRRVVGIRGFRER
jgi:hypothetical protein